MTTKINWRDTFINKFCNDHNGEMRFLRGIFYDEKDGAGEIMKFIQKSLDAQKQQLIEEIDPFDLVEDCQPDCTPEQHAYHKGTWDSYIKLEKKLNKMKEEPE